MTGAAAPLLTATRLGFAYPQMPQAVFAEVSLTVQRGEIVALIGASGCGKSTLLSVLAGLETPSSGQVWWQDQALRAPPADFAMVFQDPCLLPWLSVQRNVALGVQVRSQRLQPAAQRQRVAAALAEVGLSDAAEVLPRALSGGMAQRVALARAMARQPQLILLDEPFSALDVMTRAAMQDLLVTLVHRHQATAVLVTHDIDEALRVADRIVLLAGQPSTVVGTWEPRASLGPAPRQRWTPDSLRWRETIIDQLAAVPSTTALS